MTNSVISVEGIGKSYRLGTSTTHADNFRDAVTNLVKAPFRRIKKLGEHTENDEDIFWALKDISFEVKPGEVVGIIGRNGAGKSTLLKLLSRITEPTKGRILLNGRTSSLLEVGTGFHPELTGRENIFLNGSILGMKKSEIRANFDEIVEFSEVEKFLDTPVKRFSSGMYVRLAFAVAAHLEPEILIVDEVLAVGDIEFQKKCLGKMDAVAREGRTVLIVSHNMSVIQSLSSRAILMRSGGLIADGKTSEVVRQYLKYLEKGAESPFVDNPDRMCTGEVMLTAVNMLDEHGESVTSPMSGKPLSIKFDYENRSGAKKMDVIMTFFNHLGVAACNLSTRVMGVSVVLNEQGSFICKIPRLPLPFGDYRLAIALQVNGKNVDLIPNVLTFGVSVSNFYKTGLSPDIQYSAALIDHEWIFDGI